MLRNTKSANVFFLILTILIPILIGATRVFAQFETASVLGVIRDANGDYQFSNVKIGLYQIIVEAKGFNKTVADKVEATVNARQRVDLSLAIATATETVFITDAANPLQTDSSEVGQVIQRKQIVA